MIGQAAKRSKILMTQLERTIYRFVKLKTRGVRRLVKGLKVI